MQASAVAGNCYPYRMTETTPQLYAGTSGFAYPSWKPRFYPQALPQKKFLEHYATRLNAVEINYTFRRMPAAATLEVWAGATPAGFRFALKANQRITHFQKLKDAAESTSFFLGALEPLRAADRLGPVLFQLPPYLRSDAQLLRDYLALLPRDVQAAFEFRHESWLNEDIYALLREHGVSLCLAESEKLETPKTITAEFVYFRLRKPEYTPADLGEIRAECVRLLGQGKDLFVFFKHEDSPEGALYAENLLARADGYMK